MKKNSITILCILGLLLLYPPLLTEGATNSARDRYINAEACYKKLRHDPSKQKFRSYWMKCIDKFQGVYHQDPEGPWAAAGLYMTGKLYHRTLQTVGAFNRPPGSDQPTLNK